MESRCAFFAQRLPVHNYPIKTRSKYFTRFTRMEGIPIAIRITVKACKVKAASFFDLWTRESVLHTVTYAVNRRKRNTYRTSTPII